MRKRNKIASIFLFLAAVVVGFDALPGWCAFGTLAPGYTQCDIVMGLPSAIGIVALPDGTILVADISSNGGIYAFKPAGNCQTSIATKLGSHRYLGMAIGSDGKVYANDFEGTGNVYIVNPSTGEPILPAVKIGVFGLGMALDPLTGDLYVTGCETTCATHPNIRYITGLYGASGGPQIHDFVTVPGAGFDGLAWSCDGTRLVAASLLGSLHRDEIFQFDRNHNTILDLPVPGTAPDGVAFGKEGTPFGGYFFVNNESGTVSKIKNDGSTIQTIASGGQDGDFVAVDTNGNLLLTQNTLVTRLSTTPSGNPGTSGGQWVLPGSSLCGDLGCGAKAATTIQVDGDGQSLCLSGLNANLLLTLSQSACGGCESCATLNQARTTLLELLNSLDLTCLDPLKATVQSLYRSCPCNPNPLACGQPVPCANCTGITKLSMGPCTAKAEFPFGIDLESYDPILETFMRKASSP